MPYNDPADGAEPLGIWHWSINEYSRTRYFGKRPGNGDWHSGKYAAHTHTPLHLAFSSWLFNANGECLITRRALTKSLARRLDQLRLRPPAVRRRDEQAIIRRCRFEVGAELTDITAVAPEFRYRETDPSGIVENEICPVFAPASPMT
jgi:isopentenyldiphosphate isomerase